MQVSRVHRLDQNSYPKKRRNSSPAAKRDIVNEDRATNSPWSHVLTLTAGNVVSQGPTIMVPASGCLFVWPFSSLQFGTMTNCASSVRPKSGKQHFRTTQAPYLRTAWLGTTHIQYERLEGTSPVWHQVTCGQIPLSHQCNSIDFNGIAPDLHQRGELSQRCPRQDYRRWHMPSTTDSTTQPPDFFLLLHWSQISGIFEFSNYSFARLGQ